MGTGKNEIVKFMLEKYNLNTEKAIAFGDSGNDVRMLQAVGNGYLLKNATQEAKNLHQLITDSEYSKRNYEYLKKN